ncbi:MAG: hypothetical protein V1870_02255 [Candidatus Aenigmatarchaeota archaeon]
MYCPTAEEIVNERLYEFNSKLSGINEEIEFGSGMKNDIIICSDDVSKLHGAIYFDMHDNLVYEDLSKNGSDVRDCAGREQKTTRDTDPVMLFPVDFEKNTGNAYIEFGKPVYKEHLVNVGQPSGKEVPHYRLLVTLEKPELTKKRTRSRKK